MSDKTKISWTDASWPVVTGCTHVSEGCDHCYAAKLTGGRLRHLPAYEGLAEGGRFNGTVRLLPDRLDWPLHWRKPRRIFVSDMADLFHEAVPTAYIATVFDVMAAARQHTFQVLTKRHARLRALSRTAAFGERWPLPNVHVGVSVEDQRWNDIRVPALLGTPAAVRFLSCEPLLGPVDLRLPNVPVPVHVQSIHWVIVGGESGPGHRPMDIAWLESIVSQCRGSGIPVWVKQDSGPRAGQQGRIPDELWIHEFPGDALPEAA
jgi:protein gp37